MVDMHSHLLPFLDDGAEDSDVMKRMLERYELEGVERILATPHYISGRYENRYEDIVRAISAYGLEGRVFPGQEVSLDYGTLSLVREGAVRGLAGGRMLLLELSFVGFDEDWLSYIFELQQEGYGVILAHPERYGCFLEDPSRLNDFIREGVFFQVNGASLEGLLGPEVQRLARSMAEHGIVDFVASDAHNAGRRPPRLKGAVEVLEGLVPGLGEDVLGNAEGLLEGVNPIIQERRGFRQKRRFRFRFPLPGGRIE